MSELDPYRLKEPGKRCAMCFQEALYRVTNMDLCSEHMAEMRGTMVACPNNPLPSYPAKEHKV